MRGNHHLSSMRLLQIQEDSRARRPVSSGPFMGGTREVVKSAGGLARINVFGFLVVEISAARPFNRAAHGWQWQVGVKQGF